MTALSMTWPLTSDGAGAVTFTANDWRTIVTNLFTEGILGSGSFLVAERAAGANMNLDIAAGVGVLTGDDAANQGRYVVREDAAKLGAVAIGTADPSNPRHDLVGVQLKDPSEGGAAGRESVFAVVAGTAASSPSDPAVPDSFLTLARVVVPAGATSIVDANIQDLRVLSRLANELVDTDAIADLNVTTGKLANLAVTSGKLASNAVETAKINNLAVTTGKLADDAVTDAKAGNLGTALSTSNTLVRRRSSDGAAFINVPASPGATTIANVGYVDDTLATSWATLPMGSGWSSTASLGPIKYKKVGNVLFLSGYAVRASGSNATVGTLPAGFRPPELTAVAYSGTGSTVAGSLTLSSGGALELAAASGEAQVAVSASILL